MASSSAELKVPSVVGIATIDGRFALKIRFISGKFVDLTAFEIKLPYALCHFLAFTIGRTR
jgi:hypothetical protein